MTDILLGLAYIGAAVLLGAAALVAFGWWMSRDRDAAGKVRVEQIRMDSSWQIHQHASWALAQMIEAVQKARQEQKR